jgi:hypothetical protein
MNEGNRLSRHALTLKEDHTTGWHRLWLALDDALAGESQSARKRLHGISTEGLTDYYQFVKTMVEAILAVQEADPKDSLPSFSRGRKMLRQIYRKWPRVNLQCLMPCYRLTVKRMADDCGGFRAKVWKWWRQLDPLVPRG